MPECTPFFYAAVPAIIVALIPDADGVRLIANQQLPDNSHRHVCEFRFTWSEFACFGGDVSQIVADPQAAMGRIWDLETGQPVTHGRE